MSYPVSGKTASSPAPIVASAKPRGPIAAGGADAAAPAHQALDRSPAATACIVPLQLDDQRRRSPPRRGCAGVDLLVNNAGIVSFSVRIHGSKWIEGGRQEMK